MKYKCLRCGYENIIKSRFIQHLKRTFICKPNISNINVYDVYEYYFNNNNKICDIEISQMLANVSHLLANVSQTFKDEKNTLKCKYC